MEEKLYSENPEILRVQGYGIAFVNCKIPHFAIIQYTLCKILPVGFWIGAMMYVSDSMHDCGYTVSVGNGEVYMVIVLSPKMIFFYRTHFNFTERPRLLVFLIQS